MLILLSCTEGILTCEVTGRLVTADTKIKKYPSGKVSEWTYLRTWNPDNPEKIMWIREDDVMRQVEDILKGLKIKDPDILKKTMEYLKNVNQGRLHEINQEVGALKQTHVQIHNKLDSLIDLVADGVLTREEFLAKKSQLKDRQYEINEILDSYDKVDDKFSKKLLDLINIATNAYDTFNGSTISEKREFLNFIFANLFLRGRKVHYSLNFPFTELEKLANCPVWLPGLDSNQRPNG